MTTTTLPVAETESQIIQTVLRRYRDLPSVVQALVDLTGVVVVATLGNVKTARAVRYWLNGERLPQDREAQLRFALRLALMLNQVCGHGATQAWFKGSNPHLADRSPAVVLANDFSDDTQQQLLRAVRDLTS